MKIRILDDSIRLRMARTEVDRLGEGEAVTATTRFPGGASFVYRLGPAADDETSATFTQGTLSVTTPIAILQRWARDDHEVSIRGEVPVDGDARLSLLIEKDFECLDPRPGEDQGNRFVNPKAAVPD